MPISEVSLLKFKNANLEMQVLELQAVSVNARRMQALEAMRAEAQASPTAVFDLAKCEFTEPAQAKS